jgi:hypothetical protein
MSGKKQILDPLSCLCKIGMLAYYNIGTKISITNNIILFQEPNGVQWVKRKYFGDGKNDISTLYNPILKAIEWYILQNNEDDNKIIVSSVKNIIKYTIIGFTKLQHTYIDGNVTLAIKFLKNNLKLSLKDNLSINELMDINEMDINEMNEPEKNVVNYSKIKDIWNIDKIKLISKQFDLLDKNKHDPSSLEFSLKSLKSQLMDTDSKFQELVKNMNSCL